MLLLDYLDRYDRTHEIRPSTLTHYRWVVASFQHLHGPTCTESLTAAAVDNWLIWLRDAGRSPWTIKQRRISLLVLWRAAWLEHLAPPIEPVRRLRPCHYSPQAWTLDEVRLLIGAAETGPRPLWTASLIRAGYDTALRLGDLLALRVAQVVTPLVTICQRKTGLPVVVSLRPQTVAAIARQTADQTPGDLVWPLWGRREAFYRHFRRLVVRAGIRPGTFRWLRRTAATIVERREPGRATELLGHAGHGTTEAWYLDRSQLRTPPLPDF